MKTTLRQHFYEFFFFTILSIGVIAISQAQSQAPSTDDEEPQKRVRVEVEITENGKTSTSIQELDLDKESINGQLDEMIEEIEMILEEAVEDVEETDLEITIRRNSFGNQMDDPHYRTVMAVIPENPHTWGSEERPHAFLGVYASPIEDEELTELGLEEAVRLDRIVEGSAADRGGLMEGDIVRSIGGQEVGDFSEVSSAIKSHKPGERVDIVLIRNGSEQTINVELGSNATHRGHYEWKEDSRAFLGVKGSNHEDGALIETIIDGSAAENSELKSNDIITRIADDEISSFDDLGAAIRSHIGGDVVKIEVIRDGQTQVLDVELGTRTQGYKVIKNHGGSNYNYNYNYNYDYDYDYDFDEDDAEDRAFLGIVGKNSDDGVEVTKIFSNSSAEKMGLKEGDVIEALDGKKISDVAGLVEHLDDLEPGDKLKVSLKRDGKKEKLSGELGSRAAHCEEIKAAGGKNIKKIIMHVQVEELDEEAIAELNSKSGQNLDESNSLELDELQISPNPNNGQFKLLFDLPESGDTDIRIFDQNGQTIEEQKLKNFDGIYSNQLDVSDQPAGVYYISIMQNGKGRVARVIKQ